MHAQDRLAAHAEFCRRLDHARGPCPQIVELPTWRGASRATAEVDGTPAGVIDFTRYTQSRAAERTRTSAPSPMLREILWDFGEQRARPFVERAVAMLSDSEDPELRAEADAMREWLARRSS
ncbi:MAG TPA: hypothetical protein VG755_32475 [Nannocystaceae bacterium]|nr:hypothetical protein [Nannocystaceae bacterium]